MNTWLLLLAMSMVTFVNRYAFFARTIRWQAGKKVQRLLEYSIYSVLTAIWVPIVSNAQATFQPAYILGALFAIVLSCAKLPSIVVVLVSSGVFITIFLVT